MIIEAALQLQDGTEQDTLQDMGSNMASAYSTEQDTLQDMGSNMASAYSTEQDIRQEMGSTVTCSTQEDDLPPLVYKGTRNSCINVNLYINSLQNKMFSNCKEFDILSSDENRTSEESTECLSSLNSDTGSFLSENNSLVLMDKFQVSNDIFLDNSDFHSNICESLESCYQEKSKKKKKKKKKRIDTMMINLTYFI